MKKITLLCSGLLLAMVFLMSCKHELPAVISVPSNLIYSPDTATFNIGNAGSSVIPTVNTGNTALVFSITAQPSGITVDSITGVISWSLIVPTGSYTFNIAATNKMGAVSTTYTLIIVTPITAPNNLVYKPANDTTSYKIIGKSCVPTIINGGAIVSYSLLNAQNGITINVQTGVISWDVSVDIGSYTLTVIATNSAGSTTAIHNLLVNHIIKSPYNPD